jgi:hypothetical protein
MPVSGGQFDAPKCHSREPLGGSSRCFDARGQAVHGLQDAAGVSTRQLTASTGFTRIVAGDLNCQLYVAVMIENQTVFVIAVSLC